MDATRVRALGALVLCVACGETSPPYKPVDAAGGAAPFVEQIGEADECAEPPAPVDGVVLEGSVGIARPSDLDALANVAVITGTLSVISLHSGPLRLPNLRKVGSLELNGSPAPPDTPNQTTSLELPNLTHIDDQLYIYLGWNLAEVDLRSLQAVGSRVFIHRNIDLKTLRLDSLTDSPQLEITGNLSLPSCITESLARLGGSAANGDADTRCHCEMVCDHLKGVCEDVKTP
ncbi:MAG TPA: hypothetical protein VHP33_07740 [Polyangiaceae bacterium]|nr:hypothetical protein [Polyangiaceae bacterium]